MNKLRSLYKDLDKLNRRSRFGMKFGSGSEASFVSGLGGIAAGSVIATIAEKKMTNKVHNEINILEEKFKSCNIPFEKIEKKNFVSFRSFIDTNLNKRIENLENALMNRNTKFGSQLFNHDQIDKIANLGILTGTAIATSGMQIYNFRNKMKLFMLRIKNIEKELKYICKNKMKFGADEPVKKESLWEKAKRNKGRIAKIGLGVLAVAGAAAVANNANNVKNTAKSLQAANPGMSKDKAYVSAMYQHNPNLSATLVAKKEGITKEQAHNAIKKEINK